jgi:hypothetical protein
METKFTEKVLRTSVLEEMQGSYLAERVLRTWDEDFADEDTGNIVTIQRNEILFDKGILIDGDILTQINFYLQSEGIKDVLVSNQQRKGKVVKNSTSVYCVAVRDGKKKRNYYLYANSVVMAMAIITDFLEQKIKGGFSFVAIRELEYSNLIPAQEEADSDESEKDFYKVEIEITYEEGEAFEQLYILQASDAEEAKESIIRFISLKMKEENREKSFETVILSAKTIPCNNIVDYHFVKEYFENQN